MPALAAGNRFLDNNRPLQQKLRKPQSFLESSKLRINPWVRARVVVNGHHADGYALTNAQKQKRKASK